MNVTARFHQKMSLNNRVIGLWCWQHESHLLIQHCITYMQMGVPQRQRHRRSGLATLLSVGAIP